MPRNRRRRTRGSSRSSRRGFLIKIGGVSMAMAGGGIALQSTGAFTSTNPDRSASVSVASGGNALLGIVGQGPVQKQQRDAMVEFTNNTNEIITITVSLDNSSEGTLYDNNGGSGSTVMLTLAPGNSQFVDILANVTGTITYSVSVSSSGLNLETTGSVVSETGNTKDAIFLQQPSKDQDFTADQTANEFVCHNVDIRDNDGDNDLDKIEFRVTEGSATGTLVGSFDEDNPPGDRYNPSSVTIMPNAGYSIKSGTTYALTVTARDADGNFVSETVEDTTSGSPPTATPGASNQAPTADFTSSRKGNSPNVELDASPSSDPDGSIVSYEWDVGADGSVEYTGQTIKEAIPSGTAVKLTVTDNDGASASITKSIN